MLDVRDDGVGFDPARARRRLRPDGDAAAAAPGRAAGDRERTGRRHRAAPGRRRAGDRAAPGAARHWQRRAPRPGRPRAAAARSRGDQGQWRVTIRLLIVDDHPVVRDGLRGVFDGDPDFEVAGEAADGARGASTGPTALGVDVVLMDLRMPRMGGVEAIGLLRERAPAIRVLVLTTYDSDADVLPAIEAGATGYLLKDAPRDELVRAVRAAHLGQAVLAPGRGAELIGHVRGPAPAAGAHRPRAGGPAPGRRGAPRTRRPPAGCSSARPRSRRTCCTSTPSSAYATGRPRSPPPTGRPAQLSPQGRPRA